MTKKNKKGAAMPLIRMIDSEADALTELTLQNQRDSISFHELLLDEIDRAAICERTAIPPDVVTMGSNVPFIAAKRGAERSEECLVGKECVSTCRYRWGRYQ